MLQADPGTMTPLDSGEEIKKESMDLNPEEELRLCRICLEGEEINKQEFISPCACSGTQKYVHLNCIKTWLQKIPQNLIAGNGSRWKEFPCEICQQMIQFTIRTNLQCNSTHRIRERITENKLCLGFAISLFLLFLASVILLIIKTIEIASSNENQSYSLLIGLSIMPLVLLLMIVCILKSLLIERRIEVREVRGWNDL